jgi:hypothetical protein
MEIDNAETLPAIDAVFAQYEISLVTNGVEVLDRLPWNNDRTLRFGANENLRGFEAIKQFRSARPGKGLGATHDTRIDGSPPGGRDGAPGRRLVHAAADMRHSAHWHASCVSKTNPQIKP